ncbi:glycosyltransferase family 4 protein [Vibrio nigripulchritudo]|uniref:glycosyltransferase family 4 protein n=1 Tax=Vibrio nigripulchritudo TaxID=28173 RepID=UPI00249328B1|nr:glycosyltransferase family 4 protein [Vibrio nigripulchritudo]BDU38855.1 glycosyltransferase WbuB [Vibrio nigripulchritudo]BDU44575.1 glycosyltransferase WbuB [Vibrio nigripulchritudo]
MRILVLSFYFKPDLSAGSFRTTALVEQLKQNSEVEVDVVTTKPNRYSSFKSEAKNYEKDENVVVHRVSLPSHKSGMLDQVISYFSFYRKALKLTSDKEYDLVYATSSRLFTAFLGVRIGLKNKAPVFLDVRDIFVDTLKDVLPPTLFKLLAPILKSIEKYTFNRANHINLVSKGFESYFKDRFSCSSYSLYTNGIDDNFIGYDYQNESPSNTVLYAGNIGEGQGLEHIIPRLAKKLPEFKFMIIGDGGRKNELLRQSEEIPNVEILPPVDRGQLNKLYKQADILFLHLNAYEAFEKVLPSKLFEYGATGKPIWAGVSGYAADFISCELPNSAVFPPRNAEKAVSALNELSNTDSKRHEFINKYQRQCIMKRLSYSIQEVGKK